MITINNNSECGTIYVMNSNGDVINGNYTIGEVLYIMATPIVDSFNKSWIVKYWNVNNIAKEATKIEKSYLLKITTSEEDITITPVYVLDSYKELEDLDTEYFNFDLEHPVTMLAEKSFDGSINLVITDNNSLPKLINTGFHALNNSTYEIVDRIGKNNTNLYNLVDSIEFNLLSSLYRTSNLIPFFIYNGFRDGGILKVGNYTFYIITCDKDGNESEILAESGIISVFKGTDGDPFSVEGGIENESSDKSISLLIQDIDSSYSYIKLYYTRSTAGNNQSSNTSAYKIEQLYAINEGKCEVLITGYELTTELPLHQLNILYFNADKAKTEAIALNILFLGNLTEVNLTSEEDAFLKDLSLHIIPTYTVDVGINLNSDYSYGIDS